MSSQRFSLEGASCKRGAVSSINLRHYYLQERASSAENTRKSQAEYCTEEKSVNTMSDAGLALPAYKGGGDFLSEENLCGQNILRLTSRGSSIIAELLRLSSNIPEVFLGADKVQDPDQKKYLDVLFDFQYLKEPEDFEKNINDSVDLLDTDQEFQDNHEEILDRFYKLFESIWKYQQDFAKYVEDVQNGFYIQHSLDDILMELDGKQLLTEGLYLYGVMLILLEEKIPGFIREKMMIAMYRMHGGEATLENFEDVCKLCRNTGYVPGDGPGSKKPKNHPVAYFNRFAPDPEVVKLILGVLQTDDIYLMGNSFPKPEHRTTRLAGQASMLFVIMFFNGDMLNKDKNTMRMIVDKYFNDNWVIPTYMGFLVDLQHEWQHNPAAKSALENTVNLKTVKDLAAKNQEALDVALNELRLYLNEGVLVQDFVLDNMGPLLDCVRNCNVALRWRVLQRKTVNKDLRNVVYASAEEKQIVTLLLNMSQLEFLLKDMLSQLLNEKEIAWTDGKAAAADRMVELSEYFTGEKALSRVKRDENMMSWFSGLAQTVTNLTFDGEHATATGRKIQGLITALEDVEQFEVIDTNVQIKSFLQEVREIFRQMIRTVNIKSEIMNILENISDLSYAWGTLPDYLPVFHDRVNRDPTTVVLLRATFLKTASILDVPLVRITSIASPDAESVAEYYSSELVEFVRRVLEVIPKSVFKILSEIEQIQTHKMVNLPTRFEAKDLKNYAQLDLRFELSKLTHQVSIFTEGVLVMQKTLLGVIEVNPKMILQEGLRRELVRLIAEAMFKNLSFADTTQGEIYAKIQALASTLDGLKRSIEYLQDYIDIAGLQMYQQELSRVINYNTEMEANRYLKKKTFDSASRYQSKEVPIPRLTCKGDNSGAINFMGQTMSALLFLTDSSRTIYAPECSAWFKHSAPDEKKPQPTVEVCGVRTFALLERSLGVIGLRGLDRLFAFRTVFEFTSFLKFYHKEVHPFRTLLDQVREQLFPEHIAVPGANKLYAGVMKKLEKLMLPLLKYTRRIGQGQLIRRQITNVLQFGVKMDAHLLSHALDTFNRGMLNDIKRHYDSPSQYPYPGAEGNPLMFETALLTEACGMSDPCNKIYITSEPVEGLPVLLFIFLMTYLPKLTYDINFASLVRKKSAFPLDGTPMVLGISCLISQFHPAVSRRLIAYLGQFVQSQIQNVFTDVDSKAAEIPEVVTHTLIFLDQLLRYSSIPRSVVHRYVPPYIFDSLNLPDKSNRK